jgi:host factor-I protein
MAAVQVSPTMAEKTKINQSKEREAILEMDNTAQQNVQDAFLNNLRKDRVNVTIYLMGGVKLTGKIRSFDKFSLVLESGNLEQLIFKHAISTISVPRGSFHHPRPDSYQQHSGPALAPLSTPAGSGSSSPTPGSTPGPASGTPSTSGSAASGS